MARPFRYLRLWPPARILPCAVSFATTRGELPAETCWVPCNRLLLAKLLYLYLHALSCACPTDSTGLSPLLTRFVARSLSLSFGLGASLALFLFFSPLPIASFPSVDHCDLSLQTACQRACHSFLALLVKLSVIPFCVLLLRISSYTTVVPCLCPPGWHCILNPLFWFLAGRTSIDTTSRFCGFLFGIERNKTIINFHTTYFMAISTILRL
ncbi:hypothetical protein HDV62DRAFT_245359 [Trichoderma sp. SZMC 28011]